MVGSGRVVAAAEQLVGPIGQWLEGSERTLISFVPAMIH
jgi:hypothetical protein